MQAGSRPNSPIVAVSFVIGTLTLLGLWTVSDPSRMSDHGVLNSADFIAASVCHRIPTHGFTLFGRPLPLCARCSGTYTGIMLALMMIVLSGQTENNAAPAGQRHGIQ